MGHLLGAMPHLFPEPTRKIAVQGVGRGKEEKLMEVILMDTSNILLYRATQYQTDFLVFAWCWFVLRPCPHWPTFWEGSFPRATAAAYLFCLLLFSFEWQIGDQKYESMILGPSL